MTPVPLPEAVPQLVGASHGRPAGGVRHGDLERLVAGHACTKPVLVERLEGDVDLLHLAGGKLLVLPLEHVVLALPVGLRLLVTRADEDGVRAR